MNVGPFLILMNQTASYLVGSGDQQWNYLAGQTVIVRLDEASRRRGYMLYAPDGLTTPYPADLNRRDLIVTTTDRVGNYRLRSGGAEGVDLGFSVNYAPEQIRLDRMTDAELSAIFSPIKFQLARTREQIDRNISTGRVGRELFPPMILLVALVLAFEMLVSNRFYKEVKMFRLSLYPVFDSYLLVAMVALLLMGLLFRPGQTGKRRADCGGWCSSCCEQLSSH